MAAGSSLKIPPNKVRAVQQVCELGSLDDFKEVIHFVSRCEDDRHFVHLCGISSKIYTFVVDVKNENGCCLQFYVATETTEDLDESSLQHRVLTLIQQQHERLWLSSNGYFYLLQDPETEEIVSTKMTKCCTLNAVNRPHVIGAIEIRGGLAVICSSAHKWIIDIYFQKDGSDTSIAFTHMTSYRVGHSSNNVNVRSVPPLMVISSENVDSNLYKLLFGPDALLLQSQVLIIGFSDGQVHAFILKDSACKLDENSSEERQSALICSLHQCIKGIYLTATQQGLPNMLTIIGEEGSILVLQASQMMPLRMKVIESHIPGPVITCDFHHGHFVHSDGGQLWLSSPAFLVGGEVKKATMKRLSLIGGVMLLKLLPRNEEDAKPLAVLLTNSGRILTTNLDVLKKDDARIETIECGQTVTSVLAQISACSQQVTEAKLESERQRDLIQDLATASSLLLNEKAGECFQTFCFVHRDAVIHSQESQIRIKIENKGKMNLSRTYWQVFVSVHLKQADGKFLQHNYAASLTDDLNPGHSFSVLLPVSFSTNFSLWQLPFQLDVSLKLFVPEKYVIDNHRVDSSHKHEDGRDTQFCSLATVKLKTFIVDELYILTARNVESDISDISCKYISATNGISRCDIWERARGNPGFADVCNERPTSSASDRTSVCVSEEVAKEIANAYKSDNVVNGLYAFICQNAAVSQPLAGQELGVWCAGFPVSFFVKEVGSNIVVDITTAELFLTAKLRAAILRRFQAFHPENASLSESVEAVAVGPAIIAQSQRMQKNIESCRQLEPSRQLQHALSLYHEIRMGISSKLPLV